MHDGLIGVGHFDKELADQRQLVHGCAMLPRGALVCQGPSRARLQNQTLAPHPQVRAFAVPREHSRQPGLRLDLAPRHLYFVCVCFDSASVCFVAIVYFCVLRRNFLCENVCGSAICCATS